MSGFFGNLFDLNHDGKLDEFEKTADFITFMDLMDQMEKNENNSNFPSDDCGHNYDGGFDDDF